MRPFAIAAVSLAACVAAAADPVVDLMPKVFQRAAAQYTPLVEKTEANKGLPRTAKPDGRVEFVGPQDWTSGFFPGSLWLLHEFTGDAIWKDKAADLTSRLEKIRHFTGHHDTGFMLGCSYGQGLRLAPDDAAREVLQDGAKALASRFRPEIGMIRSWDFRPYVCPVIIDNMMNLELLTWAARNGGDARLREIAISHADNTLANHFRPDGSAYHVLDYMPEKNRMIAAYSGQGADIRTAWARGQAWAIYGFSMMHRETGKPEYLERALKTAEFFMTHPNLPSDKVPYWDFGATPGADTPRDASAAAICAAGLIEMSGFAAGEKSTALLDFAKQQLLSLANAPYLAEAGTNGGFLLARSTGHLPEGREINAPLNYADYYFLEALLRYRAAVEKNDRKSFGEVR